MVKMHTIQTMSYKTDEYHRCRMNVNLKRLKALWIVDAMAIS